MSGESFKNWTAGIHSIVVAVGLIAGACWTYTTFNALLQRNKARLEVEKLEAEAALSKKSLERKDLLNMDLAATVLRPPATDKTGRVVDVQITISNQGVSPVRLDLGSTLRFYVAPINGSQANGKTAYGPIRDLKVDYPDKTITWIVVQPGGTERLHAFQRLERPGVYIARFSAKSGEVKEGGINPEYGAATVFVNE